MLASTEFVKKSLVKFAYQDELHLLNIQKVSNNEELLNLLRSSFKKKLPTSVSLFILNGASSQVILSFENLKQFTISTGNPLKVRIEASNDSNPSNTFNAVEIKSMASSPQSSFHVMEDYSQKPRPTENESNEFMNVPMSSSRLLQRNPEEENFLRTIVREELRACLPEIVKMSLSAQQEEKKPAEPPKRKPVSEEVHQGVTCDGCGITPIVGPRYKCMECNNFDYCETCERKNEEHDHNFLKIKRSDIRAGCPFRAARRSGHHERSRNCHFKRPSESCKFGFEGLKEAFNAEKMKEIVGMGETLLRASGLENLVESIKVYLEPNEKPQEEEKTTFLSKPAPSNEKVKTESEDIFLVKPVVVEEPKVESVFSKPTESMKIEEVDWESKDLKKENCGESLFQKEDFKLPLKTEIIEPIQEEPKRVSFASDNEEKTIVKNKTKEFKEKLSTFAKFFSMDEEHAEKIIWKLGVKNNLQELINLYLDQVY